MVKTFFPDRIFRAYLFDFDGTVADTMPAHLGAWNHALGVYGLSLSLEQHHALAGTPTREIARMLGEQHKVELPIDEIMHLKETYYLRSVVEVTKITPVVDIITESHGKIPMAIVSGSRRKQVESTLNHLGLESYFQTLVCAEDYVNGKPAPDCFLQAAKILGVPPVECLAFEDAVLGIQSAHAAGMPCLRVSQTGNIHALSLT